MRPLVLTALLAATAASAAIPKTTHARLVQKYEEPATWANRSNFFFGVKGSVAIPQGARGLAPLAGIELGIAPDSGFGLGLNAIWMDQSPGAPMFGIKPGRYGFGASANFRYYFQTVGPLTLYPSFSLGFLAGPDQDGLNQVLPLINPGFGAKVKAGPFYVCFDFGLSGFTIPFVGVSMGYEGDRRADRAEAWATEQEQRMRDEEEERLQREKDQQGKRTEPEIVPAAEAAQPTSSVRLAKGQPEDEFEALPRAAK